MLLCRWFVFQFLNNFFPDKLLSLTIEVGWVPQWFVQLKQKWLLSSFIILLAVQLLCAVAIEVGENLIPLLFLVCSLIFLALNHLDVIVSFIVKYVVFWLEQLWKFVSISATC